MPTRHDRNLTLCEEFVQVAKSAISEFPDLKHSWRITKEGTSCSLSFPKLDERGFDVVVKVLPEEIVVLSQGTHQHFDSGTNESKITSALALVRDLLSPHMRIRELRAGKTAYHWYIEAFRGNKWCRESSTGLLFWNYFARRNEMIFQNNALPGRLDS